MNYRVLIYVGLNVFIIELSFIACFFGSQSAMCKCFKGIFHSHKQMSFPMIRRLMSFIGRDRKQAMLARPGEAMLAREESFNKFYC